MDTMTDEMKGLVDKAASALKAAGAKEVYVFGSASKGKMHPNSDVDLAVSGLPPEVFFRAMAAAHDALGRSLDLVDLDEDNDFTRYLKSKGELMRVG
jgi:predicted nucleotidyltransferase